MMTPPDLHAVAPETIIEPLPNDQAALADVCRLFATVFQHPIAPAHWRWKYHGAPGVTAVNLVARSAQDGALLGHAGAVILPGQKAGQALRMAQLSDVMVHPRARGGLARSGTYPRLMAAMRAQLQTLAAAGPPIFAYGFPGETPSRLGTRLGFYRPLYRCTEYLWTPEPSDIARIGARWYWRLQALPAQDWIAPSLDPLWARNTAQQAAPAVVKNAAYLRWRYAEHPVLSYTLWLLRPLIGRPVGWIITRQQPQPFIIDACLPPAWLQGAGLRRLYQALVRASGISTWSAWGPISDAHTPSWPTPIIAVEFDAGNLHPAWPAPQFQPGDTDVFDGHTPDGHRGAASQRPATRLPQRRAGSSTARCKTKAETSKAPSDNASASQRPCAAAMPPNIPCHAGCSKYTP